MRDFPQSPRVKKARGGDAPPLISVNGLFTELIPHHHYLCIIQVITLSPCFINYRHEEHNKISKCACLIHLIPPTSLSK